MNNLIKTTQLTKKLILEELIKIKIDHSIQISERELEIKINLLFEDCKEMTAEKFSANCKIIRESDLFGKFPANFKFKNPIPDSKKSEYQKWKEANGK